MCNETCVRKELRYLLIHCTTFCDPKLKHMLCCGLYERLYDDYPMKNGYYYYMYHVTYIMSHCRVAISLISCSRSLILLDLSLQVVVCFQLSIHRRKLFQHFFLPQNYISIKVFYTTLSLQNRLTSMFCVLFNMLPAPTPPTPCPHLPTPLVPWMLLRWDQPFLVLLF